MNVKPSFSTLLRITSCVFLCLCLVFLSFCLVFGFSREKRMSQTFEVVLSSIWFKRLKSSWIIILNYFKSSSCKVTNYILYEMLHESFLQFLSKIKSGERLMTNCFFLKLFFFHSNYLKMISKLKSWVVIIFLLLAVPGNSETFYLT